MTNKIDLIKYTAFVDGVTSPATNHIDDFMVRMNELQAQNTGINLPLLLNAAIGMAAEGGEFAELPKKIFFQGKAPDEAAVFHMKRELGDIIWYWTNACRALGLDPNDVIAENVNKLESRYPGGKFDPFYSENRKEGDL